MFVPVPEPRARWQTGRSAEVSGVGQVATCGDLQRVIMEMRADLAGRGRREWENPTLERFLEALEAVIEGRGGTDSAQPDWVFLAEVLVAATGYE